MISLMKKLRIILDVLRCELIGKHRSINEIQFDYPIDFVISWVDCHDPDWLQEKEKMQSDKGLEDNGPERYRDWEQLVYWFRAVEKYAPWVRKIHFVTYGHLPKWLNTNHRKLNVVNHKDYIPEQYLPTFSSSVIELNFQRISGLSEHFVYFNDDMFLNSECKKQDFFNGDYPKYCSAITPLKAYGKPKVHYHKILNILSLMNGYFDIHKCIHKHPELWFNKCNKKNYKHIRRAYRENYLQGMNHTHLGMPLRKTTIKKVWEVFPEALEITCNNKFRSLEDPMGYFEWRVLSS